MADLSIFQFVDGNNPSGNRFDLDYEVKGTAGFGWLIPVTCDEAVPGDVWDIGYALGVRAQPMIAPIMDRIDVTVDFFFVPYRLLSDDWEKFITGGRDGNYVSKQPTYPWKWTSAVQTDLGLDGTIPESINCTKYSLWDYFGFPLATDLDWYSAGSMGTAASFPDIKLRPLAWPWLAYNQIYFEYYQDQNLNLSDYYWEDVPDSVKYSNDLKIRAYRKDYFTSALPFQQRGTAPSLPLSGISPVYGMVNTPTSFANNLDQSAVGLQWSNYGEQYYQTTANFNTAVTPGNSATTVLAADLSGAPTFTVPEMRSAFAIQRWLEMNAKGGSRYVEFLRSHFGISPDDSTLQRPEFLGRVRQNVMVSEVLQTSQTSDDSPLGEFSGHGISYGDDHIDTWKATEFGLIIGLMSIMPPQSYFQGINRQWLRRSRFDYYFPEFANLSEQGIYNGEIYVQNDTSSANLEESPNLDVFGFQGRYDELRIKQSKVVADMRDTFDYWHLTRKFSSPPSLNDDFIKVKNEDFMRIFSVQNEHPFIFQYENKITCYRKMPAVPDPGLIDHVYG